MLAAPEATPVSEVPEMPPSPAGKKRELPCPECGKMFIAASGLGRHRSVQHGVPGSARTPGQHKPRVTTAGHKPDRAADLREADYTAAVAFVAHRVPTIPSDDFNAVIDWLQATVALLAQLRGEQS